MPLYEYHCPGCKTVFEADMPMARSGKRVRCDCGRMADRKFSMPRLNLNNWRPDPKAMDGEAEFIAGGGYE